MKDLPLDISTWDERCMEEFIRQNSVLFHAFASRYVDDPEAIDDFLQEAYLKLWTHRRDIGRVSSLNNYFFTILRNTILDKWTWQSHHDTPLDGEEYLNLSSNETFLAHIIETESHPPLAGRLPVAASAGVGSVGCKEMITGSDVYVIRLRALI